MQGPLRGCNRKQGVLGKPPRKSISVAEIRQVKVAQVCSRQDTAKACGGASGNRDLSSSGGLANGE